MVRLTGEELKIKYRNAKERLLLLDYDGTLVDYSPSPDKATLPVQVGNILRKLSNDPDTTLYLITGRGYKDIERLTEQVPLKIIADHGAMKREDGGWEKQVKDEGLWKKSIFAVMERFTNVCSGSNIEEKSFSLAWHYRNAEPVTASVQSELLVEALKTVIGSEALKILDGNKVVEVMSSSTGKGEAVKRLIDGIAYDFILIIGDDVSDEEMFSVLKNRDEAITIKVGEGNTVAAYTLPFSSDVVTILNTLTE